MTQRQYVLLVTPPTEVSHGRCARSPDPPSLHVDALLFDDDAIAIRAIAEGANVCCPVYGELANRVHSRATRTLADLPWAGVVIRLQIQIRKCFCDNPICPRRIFGERLEGIAAASARRTERQRGALLDFAVALGGEAGARLAAKLGYRVSPDTLLRLLWEVPEITRPTPTMLGVDDWAIHTGLTYGTILVDLERHCLVDLLLDRSSASLAAWLKGASRRPAHRPGSGRRVCRGAPDAIQVADRCDLVDNLADALENFFRSKGTSLVAATAPTAGAEHEAAAAPAPVDTVSHGKRRHPHPQLARDRVDAAAKAGVACRREKYDQARALHAKGVCVADIARTVGVSRMTVYKVSARRTAPAHAPPPPREAARPRSRRALSPATLGRGRPDGHAIVA